MTDAELEELKAGLAALPEGPWSYRDQPHDDWGIVRGKRDADGLSSFVFQAKSCFPSEEEFAAHRAGKTDPWGAIARHIVRCSPDKIAALIARLEAAEGELRRISRWERYGGEDSAPIVYPKDIAMAYFARLPAPPSKREEG